MRTRSAYLLLVLPFVLLVSLAPQAATGPVQPPIVTDTLCVASVGWGPRKADPVRAYDTLSGELIFNVYDNLITFGQPVTNSWKTDWAVNEQYWAFQPSLAVNVPDRQEITLDLHGMTPIVPPYEGVHLETIPPGSVDYVIVGFVGSQADNLLDSRDVLYVAEFVGSVEQNVRTWSVSSFNQTSNMLNLHRWYYDFQIRTSPVINYVNETGAVVDTFDEFDAQYSLMRGLVQDQIGSPMWMFYKPLFDQMNSEFANSNITEPTAKTLAYMIKDAFEILPGPTLRINLGIAFPDTALKQIIAQQWGAIVSREFSASIGCWNGDLFADGNGDGYPDWWSTIRRVSRSPYDTLNNYRYAGTGPYRVTLFDSTNKKVVFERNVLHWRGWPAKDRKSFLQRIEIDYITDWTPRRDAFIAGQYDVCAVPMANMNELQDAFGEPKYPEIITIKNICPTLSLDAALFTFTMELSSPYIGTGNFPNGVPFNFFNNTHTRKAFAYAFNHTQYIAQALGSEAICRETPLIYGLFPDYYTKGSDPPYTYDANYDKAEAELKQAIFESVSVWNSGFTLTIPIFTGNTPRRAVCYQLKNFFGNLSTYNGRTGSPFTIIVEEMDWLPTLCLCGFDDYKPPIWFLGWLADFADADNFMRPYMYSNGDFAYLQNYTADNGWGTRKDELIDAGVRTPDGPNRAAIYAELEQIYINDCPSFPIAQTTARRWTKYWVKGWYFQTMYPGGYYYHLYKEQTCWADVTGSTVGAADGVDNLRDIGYIAGHFGAVASDSSRTPPYGPSWAPGTYGYGGCDVYGDRKVDMRDIGLAASHFGHHTQP